MIPTNDHLRRTSEEKWYQYWLEHRSFHSTVDKKRTPYCIVIRQPDVYGSPAHGTHAEQHDTGRTRHAAVYWVKMLVGFREPTMPPLPRKPK